MVGTVVAEAVAVVDVVVGVVVEVASVFEVAAVVPGFGSWVALFAPAGE